MAKQKKKRLTSRFSEPQRLQRVMAAAGFGSRRECEKLIDHLVICLRRLALGGQVISHEDRVRRVQPQWLQGAQVNFPAPGNPDFAVRVDVAKHGQRLETQSRIQLLLTFQRGSLDRSSLTRKGFF